MKIETTAQNVALVSLGQTPRDDLAAEISSLVKRPMVITEFGLLDDLAPKNLQNLVPRFSLGASDESKYCQGAFLSEEPSLVTKLRDGRNVELSLKYASERMAEVYKILGFQSIDLVVLVTTMIGQTPAPARATIFCDKIVDRAVEIFAGSGLKVGVVVSLESQRKLLNYGKDRAREIEIVAAPPGVPNSVTKAIKLLKHCDIVVLHSIRHNEACRRQLSQLYGKPVVHARRLISTAIREGLDRLSEISNLDTGGSTASKLRTLSNREREIMFMVSAGLQNKAIAFRLGISFRTVEIHRARMMTKMDFRTLTELVRATDSLLDF